MTVITDMISMGLGQGIIYIPALFILKAALGLTDLVWAQPVADIFSTILAAILYIRTYQKLSRY